jgi:hypothetical protein
VRVDSDVQFQKLDEFRQTPYRPMISVMELLFTSSPILQLDALSLNLQVELFKGASSHTIEDAQRERIREDVY